MMDALVYIASGLILTKLRAKRRQVAAGEHVAHAFVGRGKEVPAWTEFAL